VDPTIPLAETVLGEADSVIITSATLRDRPPDAPDDWQSAEMRTGAAHLPWPVRRASFPSPFDYAAQARVFVVTDIDRENMDQLAAAYRELFLAVGGGALGLFTAISRLRAVHRRILPALSAAGLPLYAQHVDAMDTGTLVDIFRAQRRACKLGTDAVRDGVDVPGESLKLLVMDRVPWPRPTILERARQRAFGRAQWTDMQVRLRLRQAFGRLIRKAEDTGVFVMLDNRLARRFLTAFPEGTPVERLGLAEAIRASAAFLSRR
jgi:ATP-dependent DNA helicase DinG